MAQAFVRGADNGSDVECVDEELNDSFELDHSPSNRSSVSVGRQYLLVFSMPAQYPNVNRWLRRAYLQRTGSPVRLPPRKLRLGGSRPRALHVASAGGLTAKGGGAHDEARSDLRGPIPAFSKHRAMLQDATCGTQRQLGQPGPRLRARRPSPLPTHLLVTTGNIA
jgi:hypothetical protein